MKKILAAFDSLKYSKSTRDYAIEIAKQHNAHLVGVFLDDPLNSSYNVYNLIVKQYVPAEKLKEFEAEDVITRKACTDDFVKRCEEAAIQFSIHHDRNIPVQELLHESIYADLLVIDENETLFNTDENPPTAFIRDLLCDVQCPVLLVPYAYQKIDKVVMLYDGEPSSVYAIKMFSYLLPQFKHTAVEFLCVNALDKTLHLPDNRLMKEFTKRHYPDATYTVLKGWPEAEIVNHLRKEQLNSLIVVGAYRRSTVSRWFKESMADVLMKEIKMPLFIAHNK